MDLGDSCKVMGHFSRDGISVASTSFGVPAGKKGEGLSAPKEE